MKLEYHPLANQYPLLQGQEYEEFKEGVRRAGKIREAVVLYEGKILDGRNRYRAGTDLDIPIPTRQYDPATDGDDPELFVENANDDRRHEMPSVRKERRDARIRRVVHKKLEGKSNRTIALEEGVSESQVRKDIKASGAHQCAPERVTGQDGKTYAATKPAKEREPGEDDDVFDDKDAAKDAKRREKNTPKPKAKDGLGRVIPDSLKDVFGDTVLADCLADLEEAKQLIERAHGRLKRKIEHYPYVLGKDAFDHLDEAEFAIQCATESITPGKPYVVCPKCEGDCAKCKSCRFSGYMSELHYKELQEQGAFA